MFDGDVYPLDELCLFQQEINFIHKTESLHKLSTKDIPHLRSAGGVTLFYDRTIYRNPVSFFYFRRLILKISCIKNLRSSALPDI